MNITFLQTSNLSWEWSRLIFSSQHDVFLKLCNEIWAGNPSWYADGINFNFVRGDEQKCRGVFVLVAVALSPVLLSLGLPLSPLLSRARLSDSHRLSSRSTFSICQLGRNAPSRPDPATPARRQDHQETHQHLGCYPEASALSLSDSWCQIGRKFADDLYSVTDSASRDFFI